MTTDAPTEPTAQLYILAFTLYV